MQIDLRNKIVIVRKNRQLTNRLVSLSLVRIPRVDSFRRTPPYVYP